MTLASLLRVPIMFLTFLDHPTVSTWLRRERSRWWPTTWRGVRAWRRSELFLHVNKEQRGDQPGCNGRKDGRTEVERVSREHDSDEEEGTAGDDERDRTGELNGGRFERPIDNVFQTSVNDQTWTCDVKMKTLVILPKYRLVFSQKFSHVLTCLMIS